MSNETKDKTAADKVAENVAAAEETAQAVPEVASQAAKAASKGKKPGKGKTQSEGGESALKAVGKAACKRHRLAAVWVTDDGQCFSQESDARAHGKNLGNLEPLKVEA